MFGNKCAKIEDKRHERAQAVVERRLKLDKERWEVEIKERKGQREEELKSLTLMEIFLSKYSQ